MTFIKAGGIMCRSDFGLYTESYSSKYLYLLSFYGAPQQVRGLFSFFTLGKGITLPEKGELVRLWGKHYKFKGFSIGYGKMHGLLWPEDIKQDVVFWTNPAEKFQALKGAFARRRIPMIDEWIPKLESLMLENHYIERLEGWGGLKGYRVAWDDDAICDLIVSKISNEKVRPS